MFISLMVERASWILRVTPPKVVWDLAILILTLWGENRTHCIGFESGMNSKYKL